MSNVGARFKGWAGAMGLAALTSAGIAHALPLVGGTAPESARLEDVDDRVLTMGSLRGRPALVVYETKETSQQNAALKAELARVMKDEPRLAQVRVVAVADVSEYDFWPAKGAVKDAIREEQKKANTTIYLDWRAAFRKDLALDAATSNVVLVDAAGKFVFVRSGALGEADRRALIEAMRKLTPAG